MLFIVQVVINFQVSLLYLPSFVNKVLHKGHLFPEGPLVSHIIFGTLRSTFFSQFGMKLIFQGFPPGITYCVYCAENINMYKKLIVTLYNADKQIQKYMRDYVFNELTTLAKFF